MPKYMPLTKTQLELFSENCQIKQVSVWRLFFICVFKRVFC
jgi:hypothetical protein